MSTSHQMAGRLGALRSWSKTADRTQRTSQARRAGPGELQWHYDRLEPERFAEATEAQKLAAAEAARKAHFAHLAMKSAQSRARKSKPTAAS